MSCQPGTTEPPSALLPWTTIDSSCQPMIITTQAPAVITMCGRRRTASSMGVALREPEIAQQPILDLDRTVARQHVERAWSRQLEHDVLHDAAVAEDEDAVGQDH